MADDEPEGNSIIRLPIVPESSRKISFTFDAAGVSVRSADDIIELVDAGERAVTGIDLAGSFLDRTEDPSVRRRLTAMAVIEATMPAIAKAERERCLALIREHIRIGESAAGLSQQPELSAMILKGMRHVADLLSAE